jgi:hypothetical protein
MLLHAADGRAVGARFVLMRLRAPALDLQHERLEITNGCVLQRSLLDASEERQPRTHMAHLVEARARVGALEHERAGQRW